MTETTALGVERRGLSSALGDRAASVFEVCPDEPLELLEFAGLADEEVLGHQVEGIDVVNRLPVVRDHNVVDLVKCGQVFEGHIAAEGVFPQLSLIHI